MTKIIKVVLGLFTGNFCEQQIVIYSQLSRYLSLSNAVCHQFCLNWAVDIGRLTKASGITISIGKINEKKREAGRTIKGKLVAKGCQTTAVVDIADLLVRWEDLSAYGLHLDDSKLVLREDWQAYIDMLTTCPAVKQLETGVAPTPAPEEKEEEEEEEEEEVPTP